MKITIYTATIILSWLPQVLRAVAPANDQFAAATELVGNSFSVSGSNVDATVEVGEPAPLPGEPAAASAWWKWTASSAGWVEVSTQGSSFDTLLTVYSGTAMSALTRIGANDDDPVLPGDLETSRVRFQTAAGTTYNFAVCGFAGKSGSVSLSLAAVTAPANLVTNVTYNPNPANVTTANVTVTVQFTITTTSAFSSGIFELFLPNGTTLSSVPYSASDRTSGTATAGTYRLLFVIPRYCPPGNLPFAIAATTVASDPVDVFVSGGFGWQSLPTTLAPGLPVINTGTVDSAPPGLTSATPAVTTVDVTSADVSFNSTLVITDALSGFKFGTLSLALEVVPGQVEIIAQSDFLLNQRTSGSAQNGTYKIALVVPQNSVGGIARLLLDLTDAVGNTISVTTTSLVTVTKNAFSTWATDNFLVGPDALPGADLDGDGLNNLMEFALNMDPQTNSMPEYISGSPTISLVQQGNGALPMVELNRSVNPPVYKLGFLRRRTGNSSGIVYAAQFSSDLGTWNTAQEASAVVSILTAEWEWVEFSDPAPSSEHRFTRLKLSIP